MKRALSVAVVVSLLVGTMPVGAQQQSPAGSFAGVRSSAGDGPITRAALREASRLALSRSTEQQERRPAAAISAVREAARAVPVGKKVIVTMLTGKHLHGTLRAAGENAVTVEVAKDTITMPYDTVRSVERQYLSTGAKVAIIAGSLVAAGMLALIALNDHS